LSYYFPTCDLVTAPEILFFWVARMIMAGYEWMGDLPFKNVYLTGIVRDKKGRKMSKSLGNSPDPLELIDRFGADAVRTGMLFSSPAGNDLLYDEQLLEQGRNFANKIWNAFRLIDGWKEDEQASAWKVEHEANEWFSNRLAAAKEELEQAYASFRIADALLILYRLIWDDFCSWYLEAMKPKSGAMNPSSLNAVRRHFDELLKLLHPFMPFLTEELWHALSVEERVDQSICRTKYPEVSRWAPTSLEKFMVTEELVTAIRALRNQRGISRKEPLDLVFKGEGHFYEHMLVKLANIKSLEEGGKTSSGQVGIRVKQMEFHLNLGSFANSGEDHEKLIKERNYLIGFLRSVEAKLSNKRFVEGAPADVVDRERMKQKDAQAKLDAISRELDE
jgi:valyl-tRNA synthetase